MTLPFLQQDCADAIGAGLFDQLLPMHLLLAPDRSILHAGPTLSKMAARGPLAGLVADDVIEMRRPVCLDLFDRLIDGAGERLTLVLRGADDLPLRGVLVAMPGGGALIDISLGLSFERAVTRFGLTVSDFSPCDQTVELLYLQEANAAISRLSRRLTDRLTAAREAAELEALTDPLTQLANRRAMDMALQRLLDDPSTDFALMHLDLDFFKQVNDTMGHAAGDHVLTEVSKILRGDLRAMDMAARVGGDEFLLLLRDSTSDAAIAALAERIIRKIEYPIPFEGSICRVSASIGVALTAAYGTRPDADALMADADAALYRAKEAGRATFAIHGKEPASIGGSRRGD
jgi:diguanylate cyclase (GGDEF)-like protein